MSLVSEQQLLQNQLQLKQLDEQRQKQAEQTRSFQSKSSSTQEMLHNLRQKEMAKRDPTDPLAVLVPTEANPTDILATRFGLWRTIIGCLVHYLKEIVSVHEEISRQQIRLHHAITFPFVTQGLDGEFYQPVKVNTGAPQGGQGLFGHKEQPHPETNDEFEMAEKFFLPLGNGSIQDLPTVLYQYHSNSALLAQATVKELNGTIIPRLEDLKRDLIVKIKEIKSLQSDFKNQVARYHQETKQELNAYIKAVETAKHHPELLTPKDDPYLLRFNLNRLIKRQLTEENYLHEAFNNLQGSGKELEKVVYIEIQTALTVYAKLIGQQAQNVFDGLISKLDTGLLTKDPSFEWDSFVAKDTKNFIDVNLPMRHLSEIHYQHQNDPLTFEIRSGFLERKSKYLKSYSKGYYVLTPTFLHEFKSADRKRDPVPIMSLAVEDCQVAEHSKKDEHNPNSYHKFVLHAKQNGLLRKGHNWVFRAESYDQMMSWYNDLKKVTGLPSPQARSVIGWERKKQERLSSLASSSMISKNRRDTNLTGVTDQSSYKRGQSPRSSIAHHSLNTVLSLPKNHHPATEATTVADSEVQAKPRLPIDINNSSFVTLETGNGYVDEKIGDMTLSDESKKDTQM
ncbi:hypothetical protein KL918_002416 [Ogataea parapolymorpha]|uniref:Phosphoinositide PI4,5P(2) binding protein, forms a complex with Slm2p n=1 Tax=Ogataea parapolymorpha (strain ATCC 26012 / BCRC 20466 / JCM 22074 / NRRL Y-7560 / DL-1) TaxID=871575 RepID=W1QJK6_OGAPD|nr:Phosphoinositide PI4,5P(2) binding protein, forms a complex with Slm2p [Ogataea parapolymorpha DL-1]ESX02812.1 Phosphoinositide PI4,5P(2) binding protein, forms a complex with Slm2p [Ogataea parapolymorpha DL-1]KAG7867819.1 hypothetical protein KL918_002416 [Ogataea parapolymorpha]KAG7870740.1 hypothetical protein KL916_004788 [Ogataea parapolymorpha]